MIVLGWKRWFRTLEIFALALFFASCASAGPVAETTAGSAQGASEVEVSGYLSVAVSPLDEENGTFFAIDGLALQADGSLGTSMWTFERAKGFEAVQIELPPMVRPTVWRSGSVVNIVGVPCPQLRAEVDRDYERHVELCSDQPAVMMRFEPASRAVSTVAEGLPASIDPPLEVVPGPKFTLLQAARYDEGSQVFSFDVAALDNDTGEVTTLATSGFARACPSGDGFIRYLSEQVPDSTTEGEQLRPGEIEVITSEGVVSTFATPEAPAAVASVPLGCAPDGGAEYPAELPVTDQRFILRLDDGRLTWEEAPSLPPGPEGLVPQQASGVAFGWVPLAGTDSFDQWALYELTAEGWNQRGTIASGDEPARLAFSGSATIGIVFLERNALLRELP